MYIYIQSERVLLCMIKRSATQGFDMEGDKGLAGQTSYNVHY